MDKIKKENSNLKNINFEKTLDLQKSEVKNILIKEIDKLNTDFKKISKELILLADYFDISQQSQSTKKKLDINELKKIKETINIINNCDNISIINLSNNMIKTSLDKLNSQDNKNRDDILRENNEDITKSDLLQKKRNKTQIDEGNNVLVGKIRKSRDKQGNIIGYYIKVIYYDNIIKLGPWKNINFVINLKNIFVKKLSELKINKDPNRDKFIEKFYEDFKNKTYIKYPPLPNNF